MYVSHTFRICLSVERYLGLYILAFVAEQESVEQDVESFGQMPRSGIARSYGKCIFSLLKILHTAI